MRSRLRAWILGVCLALGAVAATTSMPVAVAAVVAFAQAPAPATNVSINAPAPVSGSSSGITPVDCTASGVMCWYIRDGGTAVRTGTGTACSTTGTGSGTTGSGNWAIANSCDSLPATLTRTAAGAYYLHATGTYPNMNLSTAASSTNRIYIIGATNAYHGIDAGPWSSSLSVSAADGGSQAHITPSGGTNISISTNYWTVNGNAGSTYSYTSTAYGFGLNTPSCPASLSTVTIGAGGSDVHDVQVSHMAMIGCRIASDTAQDAFGLSDHTSYLHELTISNNFIDGFRVCYNTTNFSLSTIEYNVCWRNFSTSAFHGEPMNTAHCHRSDPGGVCNIDGTNIPAAGFASYNVTIRFNIWDGCGGTACIAALACGPACGPMSMRAYKIYGNQFINCEAYPTSPSDSYVTDGIISSGGPGIMRDVEVYNNTFIDCATGGKISKQCDDLSSSCSSASGNIFRNNYFYNVNPLFIQNQGGAYTTSHNSYCGSTPDSPPSETGRQFPCGQLHVSSTNFHLASDTSAWTSLASPYNVDPDGVTRTSSRGAYQFVP